jgi:hypothetical protein
MKSLTILIYSILFSGSAFLKAQIPSFRIGIYDFTGNTASEFYVLAPTVMLGYYVWKRSQLDLQVSSGIAFNRTRFNSHYHYLYMVPLMTTIYYNLPNPGAKVWPAVGIGVSLLGKIDHNIDYDITHQSLTYGYHATGRVNIPIKEKFLLNLEMTYNLMIHKTIEEVDPSGVILTVGLDFSPKELIRQKIIF